jgi:hypothetical protein
MVSFKHPTEFEHNVRDDPRRLVHCMYTQNETSQFLVLWRRRKNVNRFPRFRNDTK